MGELSAGLYLLHQFERFCQSIVSRQLLHSLFTEANIQQPPFAHIDFIFREEERQLGQLQAQCKVGTDNARRHIERVILPHQPRRNINRHHPGRRGIDKLYHCGKPSRQRLVKPAAEKAVDDDIICRQLGEDELSGDFVEIDIGQGSQPFHIKGTVGRKIVFGVKQKRLYPVSLLLQQTGHSQGIAPVVARTGKDREGSFRTPPPGNGPHYGPGSALHQVDGSNRFIFYRIGIKLFDVAGGKNLHKTLFCKVKAKVQIYT